MLKMAEPDDMDVDYTYPVQSTHSNNYHSPFQSNQGFFNRDRLMSGLENNVTDLFGKIHLNGQEKEPKEERKMEEDTKSIVPYNPSPSISSTSFDNSLFPSSISPAIIQSQDTQQQQPNDNSSSQQLDINHSIPSTTTTNTQLQTGQEGNQPYVVLHHTHDYLNESHGSIHFISGLVRITFVGSISLLLVYSAAYLIKTLKYDIGNKIAVYEAVSLEEVMYCQRQYEINKCDPETQLQALKELCQGWANCMYRPASISHSKVIAEIIADIANGFIETITLKTLITMIVTTWTFLHFWPSRS